jgi:hypothetical protein
MVKKKKSKYTHITDKEFSTPPLLRQSRLCYCVRAFKSTEYICSTFKGGHTVA